MSVLLSAQVAGNHSVMCVPFGNTVVSNLLHSDFGESSTEYISSFAFASDFLLSVRDATGADVTSFFVFLRVAYEGPCKEAAQGEERGCCRHLRGRVKAGCHTRGITNEEREAHPARV